MCVFSLFLQLRGRVVVVKYDRKPLSNKTLFAFSEPFGCLREHLVLKNKVCTLSVTDRTEPVLKLVCLLISTGLCVSVRPSWR